MQITFVLQSFQQLRSVYGEDVEKIIRANSSNTIFLKSNDQELVDELVRLSGVRHEFRVKGKSVSRKIGDVVTVSEPVINYSGEHIETTALTSNDLLFLAGPSPGNSITFSSGEMPIVNKLSTITPMAAGLHKHLPQPKTGQYSDSNMPSTNTNDSINFLDNVIDGDALVQARVAQAKIAMEVKETVLQIASENNIVINERNGELADLIMNIVYERYDNESGQMRQSLSQPTAYHELASRMADCVKTIAQKTASQEDKLAAAKSLKEDLVRCLMDPNLADLVAIYKDKPASTIIRYDAKAVSEFVARFKRTYPTPKKLNVDKRDLYQQAKEDPRYKEYKDPSNVLFDPLNPNSTAAFEEVVLNIWEGVTSDIPGLELSPTTISGQDAFTVIVDGDKIADFKIIHNEQSGEDEFDVEYIKDNQKITQCISENKRLLAMIESVLNDNY